MKFSSSLSNWYHRKVFSALSFTMRMDVIQFYLNIGSLDSYRLRQPCVNDKSCRRAFHFHPMYQKLVRFEFQVVGVIDEKSVACCSGGNVDCPGYSSGC